MTEWIRKKFLRNSCEQNSFTSYVEKELDGFIVIPHNSVQAPEVNSIENIKDLPKVDCDYESLYSYLNPNNEQIASPYGSLYPMGCAPSMPIDSSKTNVTSNIRSRRTSLIDVAPFPSMTSLTNTSGNNPSEIQDTNYFLNGIPFKLSKEFSQVDEIQELQKESYDFLKHKISLLEKLDYAFRIEKEVLKESISEN